MKKLEKMAVALTLLGFVLAGIFFSLAPEQIPVHYNAQGEVDRWGSKYEYLILPVINLVSGVVLAWLARFEGKKGREMNEKLVGFLNIWMLTMFNLLWLFFYWNALDTKDLGSMSDWTVRGIMILLFAALILLGNWMPKAQRNSTFGVRTKWSMANDWCWQQSQRVGGFASVVTGILGVILCAVLPVQWCTGTVLVLIAAMAAVSSIASYRIYRKSQNP